MVISSKMDGSDPQRNVLLPMLRRLSLYLALTAVLSASERPRLAVLTDIGGDPDDQQALVRLMLYANEFEIEALIASASGTRGELKKAITQPDLIRRDHPGLRQGAAEPATPCGGMAHGGSISCSA